MTTVIIYDSVGLSRAPGAAKAVFSTEAWSLAITTGRRKQVLPAYTAKFYYSTHNGEMRFRYAFACSNGARVDVHWRCDNQLCLW